MNTLQVVGNLTRDVEVRQTNGGTSVCNFTVAVNENYTDKKSGEEKRTTAYINFEAWGWQAKNMESVKKGSQLVVVGSPRSTVRKEGERPELVFRVLSLGIVPKSRKAKDDNEEEQSVGVGASEGNIPF